MRDSAASGAVTVRLTSAAEPEGEALELAETVLGMGIFTGSIEIERLFAPDGSANPIAKNGRIAVYAEGSAPQDTIVVTYRNLSKQAAYTEPASTVTGIVAIARQPQAGAGVTLQGAGGFLRSTVSRPDGSYAFHDVPSGNYLIVAKVRGGARITTPVTVP